MGRVFVNNIIRFIVLMLIQIVLFKNIGYYNIATTFPYIFFLFFLPIGLPNFVLFLIAFLTGLSIDAFYDSIGVHACACIALALFRILYHKITLEMDVKDSYNTPSLSEMGFKWFLPYTLLGTLTHHFILFLVESFSFTNILHTLFSIGISSIFTSIVILLMALLVYRKRSRIGNI